MIWKFPLAALAPLCICAAAAMAAAQAAGDAERGAALYESRCTGCHSLDANRIGPMHRGVYGRRAGTAEDFDYSEAVAGSGIMWAEDTLERWLSDPERLIPGQRMSFRVAKAEDRGDIIAFLKRESGASRP